MAQIRRRYTARSSGGSDTPYNGYTPPTSGTPDETVIELTLVGHDSVTRGDTATFTATVLPRDLSPAPTFDWTSRTTTMSGKSVVIQENTGPTNKWSGIMVRDSTIEVTMTVNGKKFSRTMNTTVSDRAGWKTDIPFSKDTTTWGEPEPRDYHHLGRVEYSMPFSKIRPKAVPSGPNKDFWYLLSINISAPFTVKINKHFSMAEEKLPQSWRAFREAQGGDGEPAYGIIEERVKKHEGYDGPDDLETLSHYMLWNKYAIRTGTAEDPKTQVERTVGAPTINEEKFRSAIASWLTDTFYIEFVLKKVMYIEPPTYLDGNEIDFEYIVPENQG